MRDWNKPHQPSLVSSNIIIPRDTFGGTGMIPIDIISTEDGGV